VPALEAYLRKDPLANIYLIYDLLYERHSRANFNVAEEGDSIVGVLLRYNGYPYPIAVALGSDDAVGSLLDTVPIEKVPLLLTPELSKTQGARAPDASKYDVNIMALSAPAVNLNPMRQVRRLGAEDAHAFARSVANRVGLSHQPTTENILEAQELLAKNAAFGAFDDNRLIARANAHIQMSEAWAIGGIFTEPEYRGRGLATSVTSALVQEALRHTHMIVLFVRSNNIPANNVYRKIGFRTISKRVWLDMGKSIMP
jgi:ribosomal protein S18 acetylase RimI-like enzyme